MTATGPMAATRSPATAPGRTASGTRGAIEPPVVVTPPADAAALRVAAPPAEAGPTLAVPESGPLAPAIVPAAPALDPDAVAGQPDPTGDAGPRTQAPHGVLVQPTRPIVSVHPEPRDPGPTPERAEAEPPRRIEVTIGRLEVRATPARGGRSASRVSSEVMGLDEYLARQRRSDEGEKR